MGEQKGRRPSGTSSQGLSSFPNQMSSYPVLSDSYLERLLGNLIINSRTSRTKGFVLFSEDEKALGAYVVWEGRVKVSIGSDNGKSLILTLAGRGAVLGLPETILGLPYAATAEVVEATKASFLFRDHLLRRLRDTEARLHSCGKSKRDLLFPHGRAQGDPPNSIRGAKDGPLPFGTASYMQEFQRPNGGGANSEPGGDWPDDRSLSGDGGKNHLTFQKATNT